MKEPQLDLDMELEVMPPPQSSSLKRGREEEGEKIFKTDKRIERSRVENTLCDVKSWPVLVSPARTEKSQQSR